MTPIAAAARVDRPSNAQHVAHLPPNDQSDALVLVATRLLSAAADPATQWTPSGHADAERVALEMLPKP
jgi:hypothetical protein